MGALWITFVVTFLVTLYITPYWIKKAHFANLVGKDIHKTKPTKVAEMGGITVILGFISGILVYIATRIFFFNTNTQITYLLAILTAILIASIIGLIDDILGWKIGLKQWQKPILMVIAAIPVAVINAGESIVGLPIIGNFDLGLLFPLLIIPIAISGASNGFNMIAGYNGLEAGMGMIILTALGYIAWLNDYSWVTMIALCMAAALAGFYMYNKIPAKIFGGDSLTYPVGALIGCIAILGNMEKVSLIIFTPYIIEFFLKARGRFKKESFAKLNKDGSLSLKYKKIYGLEHLILYLKTKMGKKVYEQDVILTLFLIQLLFIILGFIYIY